MRFFFKFLIFFVCAGLNISCTHDDEPEWTVEPGVYGTPYYPYVLNIEILDKAGNNLVEQLDSCYVTNSVYTTYISPEFVTISEKLGKNTYKYGIVRILTNRKNREVISITNSIEKSGAYSSTYEVQLVCQPLFGDYKTHTIESKWKHKGWMNYCQEIKLDGKKCSFEMFGNYEDTIVPGKTYLLEATVVLDR